MYIPPLLQLHRSLAHQNTNSTSTCSAPPRPTLYLAGAHSIRLLHGDLTRARAQRSLRIGVADVLELVAGAPAHRRAALGRLVGAAAHRREARRDGREELGLRNV